MPDIRRLKLFIRWHKSIKKSKIIDFYVVLIISFIAIVISLSLASNHHVLFYTKDNLWFGSDIERVYNQSINFQVARNYLHPLFSLFMFHSLRILSFFGFCYLEAACFLIALSGAIVSSSLYLTLRFTKLTVVSSVLGSAVFLSSGAFVFWWSVIETFPIGAVMISIIFLLQSTGNKSKWIWVISSASTLGITVSNWMVAIIAVFLTFSRLKALKILLSGSAIVIILYLITNYIYSSINPLTTMYSFASERSYLVIPKNFSDFPLYLIIYMKRSIEFFIYPAVLSEITSGSDEGYSYLVSTFFNYNISALIAIACWVTLVLGGVIKIFRSITISQLAQTLLLFILFQFLLHLFYGEFAFLYSAHYAPALVIIASYSFQGKYVKLFQSIAFVFCLTAIYSNMENFNRAITLVNSYFNN
ncbi:MAG: hypothetical protein ACI8YP_002608 [Algoriphagus sp.]|jgi:hypothetical protein